MKYSEISFPGISVSRNAFPRNNFQVLSVICIKAVETLGPPLIQKKHTFSKTALFGKKKRLQGNKILTATYLPYSELSFDIVIEIVVCIKNGRFQRCVISNKIFESNM